MLKYILIVVAAGLLSGLVWAESTGNNWLALGFKTPARRSGLPKAL